MTDPNNDGGDRRSGHEGATEFEEFLEEGVDAPSDVSDAEILEALEPESEVDILTREVNQFKDTALRLQADFENYRKRIATQQHADIDRAVGKVVEALLPVLDACEAAFTHGVDGVEPIWSQLMGVLQKQGLEALDLTGKPFDPALADAVVHEDGDGATDGGPVVTDVLRTGYSWKSKTLRAAMVKVRG
jgi:molecular chaperone GrpE